MPQINLSDSRGRDAVVATASVSSPLRVRWIDESGSQVTARKVLRATVDRELDALLQQFGGPEEVGKALLAGDPEIDIERFGSFLSNTSRAWIDANKQVVHRVAQWEIVRNPDGTERERRPKQLAEQNVATETPLKWTGKLMKKSQVYNRFVFGGKIQIVHVNGLTYDFLYGMAKELEEKESLMLLGAGPKSATPLVLRRAGTAYRGFLEGRTQGDRYALVLHLSNMELKVPKETEG